MYDAPGIGLAAIQVGVPKRVIVMDLARGEEPPADGYRGDYVQALVHLAGDGNDAGAVGRAA